MNTEAVLTKKPWYKNKWFIYLALIAVLVVFIGSGAEQPAPLTAEQQAAEAKTSEESQAKAKVELEELMGLSIKAKLVKSYEFSNMASIVYIDSSWYGQTAIFKRDFLTKVALLKKEIIGYANFEVRDAYSNELVAKSKSVLSAPEIYK